MTRVCKNKIELRRSRRAIGRMAVNSHVSRTRSRCGPTIRQAEKSGPVAANNSMISEFEFLLCSLVTRPPPLVIGIPKNRSADNPIAIQIDIESAISAGLRRHNRTNRSYAPAGRERIGSPAKYRFNSDASSLANLYLLAGVLSLFFVHRRGLEPASSKPPTLPRRTSTTSATTAEAAGRAIEECVRTKSP